ncbi:MAG: hypothetical protein GY943_09475, partial [Chloroflexi bacterium]|nr:hypothetical protein [Chloroflexota bacterium]
VGCLFMILLLVVRSMSTFGYWWGWPLVITAVSVFIATFVLPTILSALLGASILPTGGETVAVLAQDFVRGILDSVTDIWLNRVTMQAIVMFVVGLLLIGFGVLTRSQKSTIQQF